jgi:hypothetical protein
LFTVFAESYIASYVLALQASGLTRHIVMAVKVRTGSGSDRMRLTRSLPLPVLTNFFLKRKSFNVFIPNGWYVILFSTVGGKATHETHTAILCDSVTK